MKKKQLKLREAAGAVLAIAGCMAGCTVADGSAYEMEIRLAGAAAFALGMLMAGCRRR